MTAIHIDVCVLSQGDEQRELKPTDQRRTKAQSSKTSGIWAKRRGRDDEKDRNIPGNLIKGTSDERLERIDGWGQSSYCELGEERRKKSVRRDVEDKRVPHVVLAFPTTVHLHPCG